MTSLNNQRGEAFLFAVIALTVSLVAFLVLQVLGQSLEKKVALSRARAQQSRVEAQIRQHFLQPSAFTGCQSSSGTASCQVNQSAFAVWARVPGRGGLCAAVPTGGECEFRSEIIRFDPAQRQVRVRLQLQGALQLSPSEFVIDIPDEILQSSSFTCADLDAAKPLLTGYDTATGQVLCRGLHTCAENEFMVAVGASSSQPQCAPLPVGTVNCGSGQMLGSFEWRGGSNLHHTCQPRLDPFTYFGGP